MKIITILALLSFLASCGKSDSSSSSPQREVTAPLFSFSPVTVGDSGTTEGYDSTDWPYEGVGDAAVLVSTFDNADGVVPTCRKTSVSFAFVGDPGDDCDGSNTPSYDSCECIFNGGSTTTGECRLSFSDVCSSDNEGNGDRIYIGVNLNAPLNAPSESSVVKSYKWYVLDSD